VVHTKQQFQASPGLDLVSSGVDELFVLLGHTYVPTVAANAKNKDGSDRYAKATGDKVVCT
jgi:hypothetical protein